MKFPSRRFLIRLCLILVGALFCFSLLSLGILLSLNKPPVDQPLIPGTEENIHLENDGSLLLEVRNGESAASVGNRLEGAGVIKSRFLWRLLSRLSPEPIKAGVYRLELPATQTAIHTILVGGRQILLRITIPEGLTLKKTAHLLAQAGICGEEDFLAAASDPGIIADYGIPNSTLEGYLYPDTYRFPPDFPPARVVRTMVDTFFTRLEEFIPEFAALSPQELNQRIIIASIVEREYRVDDEAPLMAGVFYNRLDISLPLQSCATVEYVITEIQGKPHPETLLTRDTEIPNPYNTYLHPGFPPGPICAPGKTAILAAFHPILGEYLYFRLTDPAAGRHYFSRTLDDHIRAGILYLK
jgi:UPF0755 protein